MVPRSLFPVAVVLFALALHGCSDSPDSYRSGALVTPSTDCFWLEYDKDLYNYGNNDTGATFWLAVYSLPEDDAYISFESAFPYARYMSLTTYSLREGALDSLVDRDVVADFGSINPFVEGNPRNDPSRRYLVRVDSGLLPENALSANENVLYGGSSGPDNVRFLGYRVYAPNSGLDASGGVGVPRVTLHMADGSVVQGQEACNVLSIPIQEPPRTLPPAEAYAELRGNNDPSRNPPVFRAAYNNAFRVQCDFLGDCSGNPERIPGTFANPGSAYMYSFMNRQNGEVLVIRGKIPDTPRTIAGTDDVFMERELRYWSICPYEYYSSATTECLFDEEITINEDGFYTIVYSRDDDRPDNATRDCGVEFIPWSPAGDGFSAAEGREDNSDDGYLFVRNMLPADDFEQAIHDTQVPGDEAEVMGEYLPKGRHYTKAEFEGLGCNPWLALPYDEL